MAIDSQSSLVCRCMYIINRFVTSKAPVTYISKAKGGGGGVAYSSITVVLLGSRYDLMLSCWRHKSEERPTFAFVMQTLKTIAQVGHLNDEYMSNTYEWMIRHII